MMKALILFVFLATGCGKGGRGIDLPVDSSTPEEKQKIASAIELIEKDLADGGVYKDLSSVKIIVSDFDDNKTKGRCYQRDDGTPVAIVLSHEILSQDSYDDNLLPWYFTVLLHEVGHCHFNRQHESVMINLGNQELVFPLILERKKTEYTMSWISPTVMNVNGERMILNELRGYYVKEIANLDRAHSWEDFTPYANLTIRERPKFTK